MISTIQTLYGDTETWRLLDIEYRDPYKNIALEEALLISAEDKIAPNTIRFWKNQNAVVIGRSQSLEKEVNLEACEKHGTSIVRRFTGGGAVYQDYGNLNWTVIFQTDCPLENGGVSGIFKAWSLPILDAINRLEIPAEFISPNSIFIGGKKVSGMAAYVKRESILCHGTLLINTNLNMLSNVLKNIRYKVTNLQYESNTLISLNVVKRTIIESFNTAYDIEVKPGKISIDEAQIMKELYSSKYSKGEWNFKI